MGAIAFFGDKYGESVRVVQAGSASLEFCGGTHVDSLGQIGPITLLSEGSIGSNTRRLFALTGHASLQRAHRARAPGAVGRRAAAHRARRAAGRHRSPGRAPARDARRSWRALRQQSSEAEASDAGRGGRGRRRCRGGPPRQGGARRAADAGPVDPAPRRGARRRARRVARRDQGGDRRRDRGTPDANQLVRTLGPMVGGGGGGSPEVAQAGGKDPSGIEAALAEAQRLLSA